MLERIPTGFAPLDGILGGGVDAETITEAYGAAGSGKTNLAMMLSYSTINMGKKTVYIDTEGISIDRLRQICGDDFDDVIEEMMIRHVYSLEEQDRAVRKAVDATKTGKVGLIVVDSMTGLYRMNLGTDDETGSMRSLTRQMIGLLTAARMYEFAVFITNQVYTDRESGEFRPIGGHVVDHYAKTIIRMDKVRDGRRRAIIMKHRSVREGKYVSFGISERGFEETKDMQKS